ncbi:invasion associated locus B family protein [Mariluticola halotolerans]|uniref:invasion associated locus B family protein n=1 Tax=Mariluticola halotolerans TaxID=2909283 RepID=UPI0026E33482|nr:invasion associated locus B family protein [Mariluticola halotolerans]UJQ95304.1 invasion associated locus B family protein [Mariluticola halotolerans]
MSGSFLSRLSIAALVIALVTPGNLPAFAEDNVGPWQKVCTDPGTKNESCVTRQIVTDADGQRGQMLMRLSGDGKLLVLSLRVGLSLRRGWIWSLDAPETNYRKYLLCQSGYCSAHFQMTDDLLTKILQTDTLEVTGFSLKGEPFTVSFDTQALAEALDGPGMSMEEFQRQENQGK